MNRKAKESEDFELMLERGGRTEMVRFSELPDVVGPVDKVKARDAWKGDK